MLARTWMLALSLCVAVAGCGTSEDEGGGCTPSNGSFGARCCGGASDCSADLSCRSGQCTKPCDAGADCAGLAADGGARPCSNGFCVPAPLPVNGGSGDDHGW